MGLHTYSNHLGFLMIPKAAPTAVYLRIAAYLLISGIFLYFRAEITAFLILQFGREYHVAFFVLILFFQVMLAYAVGLMLHIVLGWFIWRVFIKK